MQQNILSCAFFLFVRSDNAFELQPVAFITSMPPTKPINRKQTSKTNISLSLFEALEDLVDGMLTPACELIGGGAKLNSGSPGLDRIRLLLQAPPIQHALRISVQPLAPHRWPKCRNIIHRGSATGDRATASKAPTVAVLKHPGGLYPHHVFSRTRWIAGVVDATMADACCTTFAQTPAATPAFTFARRAAKAGL
jgi:hypothetical protein